MGKENTELMNAAREDNTARGKILRAIDAPPERAVFLRPFSGVFRAAKTGKKGFVAPVAAIFSPRAAGEQKGSAGVQYTYYI